MKLLLCAYADAGANVLRQAVDRPDVDDIYLFTHDPASWSADIRATADELGVPWTTESVNGGDLPFRPDVISSVWFGEIIRQPLIDLADGRIFNLHPSLLPRHRGCSSVTWAIVEGDKETGVTAHYIDTGTDTGRIIGQRRLLIAADETQATLYRRAMDTAAGMWSSSLDSVLAGEPGAEQTGEESYHRRGAPFDGEIDDSWPDDVVERFIRAMTFPPLPYAGYRGREVRTMDEYLTLKAGGT